MEIFILHDGEQSGPHSYGSVKDNLDSGAFSLNDLAWMNGLESWKPLWEILGVSLQSNGEAAQGTRFTLKPDPLNPPERLSSIVAREAALEELSKRKKQMGGIRQKIRALYDLLDHRLTRNSVLAIVALLLIASWIYPPWVHYGRYQRETPRVPHGWFFILDTQQHETGDISRLIMRIDLGRLLLIDGILAAAGWLLVTNRRLALYSLCAAFTIALCCLVFAFVGNVQHQAQEQAAKEEQAALERASMVNRDDLKKITLFDAGAVEQNDTRYNIWIGPWNGRVRDGLSRAVQKLVLRVSIYNAQGELIEVQKIGLDDFTVSPGEPASFDDKGERIYNLPAGYKWTVELAEAHYVQ